MVRNIMIVVSVLSTNARLGETETERQRVQKKQKSKRARNSISKIYSDKILPEKFW